MRYVIRFDAPLGRELQRYIERLVDNLVLELLRTRYDLQTGIHNARKMVKETRAILRLLKPLQSETHFDNWQLLKAIATATADLRDTHVSDRLWASLSNDLSSHPDYRDITARLFEQNLEQQRQEQIVDTVNETIEQLQVLSTLLLQRKQYLLLPPPALEVDPDWLAAQYGHLYRKARKVFIDVKGVYTADNRHDCRKRCKDLMYALGLFKVSWNSSSKMLAKRLSQSTDWLGDANDLAVIEERVLPLAEHDPEGLQAYFSHQRELLWHKADDKLTEIFDVDEAKFVRHIRKRLI